MLRRIIATMVMVFGLFSMSRVSASAQAKPTTANVNSDRVLFVRAQKAFKKSNYAEARSLLETLIDTYPDSDYLPRAKLSVADSFYSEHALRQAEMEYRDFITFFPNRREVGEAQRRIDFIQNDLRF